MASHGVPVPSWTVPLGFLMPFHIFRPADHTRPERIPIRVWPSDAATENLKTDGCVDKRKSISDGSCAIEKMHVCMLTRACERDAMKRMYIRTTPDRAAPEVSHLSTFSEQGASRPVGGCAEAPDLKF